eukprot:PhF_6_TR26229/c0_g1_i2/m.37423
MGNVDGEFVGSTPPDGGRVDASTFTPTAYDTVTFSALDWIADTGASPLTYQWSLLDEVGLSQPLSEVSSNLVTSFQIVQPEMDTCVWQVIVTIRDQRGDSTTIGIPLIIHRASLTVENRVIASALTSIEDLHRQGSSSRVVQTLLTATWGSTSTSPALFSSAINILNNITITEDIVGQVSSSTSTMTSQSSLEDLRNKSSLVRGAVSNMLETDVLVDATIHSSLLQTVGSLGTAFADVNQTSRPTEHDVQQRTQSLRDIIDLSTTLGIKSMMGATNSEARVVNTGTFTMGCVVKGVQDVSPDADGKTNKGGELSLGINDPSTTGTFCQTQWGSNLFASVQRSDNGRRNVTSGVTSIIFAPPTPGAGLRQSPQTNISFVLRRSSPKLRNTRPVCSYYDFNLRMFSSVGCRVSSVSSDGSEITC